MAQVTREDMASTADHRGIARICLKFMIIFAKALKMITAPAAVPDMPKGKSKRFTDPHFPMELAKLFALPLPGQTSSADAAKDGSLDGSPLSEI